MILVNFTEFAFELFLNSQFFKLQHSYSEYSIPVHMYYRYYHVFWYISLTRVQLHSKYYQCEKMLWKQLSMYHKKNIVSLGPILPRVALSLPLEHFWQWKYTAHILVSWRKVKAIYFNNYSLIYKFYHCLMFQYLGYWGITHKFQPKEEGTKLQILRRLLQQEPPKALWKCLW